MSTSAGELRFVDERGFSYFAQVDTTKTSFGGVITQRFSGAITEFAAPDSQFPDGSVVVKGTITGSVGDSGNVFDALIDPDDRLLSTVGGFRDIFAFYDSVYQRNSSLALVSGTWRDGTGVTYSIDGNGAIFGQTSAGCVYDGQVSLIDSNNNLYRVHIDVSSCQDEDGSFTGLGALFGDAESGDNERFLFLGNESDIKALTLDLSRM